MFRPEKMCFVNISVLDEHITQVLDRLTKMGVMHVVDKKELYSASELKNVNIEPSREKLTSLNNRIVKLLAVLGIESNVLTASPDISKDRIQIDPLYIADKIEKDLSEIENEVNPVIQRREQIQAEITDMEENSRRLFDLEAPGVKVEDLKETRFLYFASGDIPLEYHNRLVSSLSNVPCVLVTGRIIAGRQQIMAFSLMSNKEALANALIAAYFMQTRIPEKYHGFISDVLDEIELDIWAKREEMAEIEAKIRSMRKSWRNKLLELYFIIMANQLVLESMENFGRTDRAYFLSGWVPHRDVKKLGNELKNVAKNSVFMSSSEPMTAREALNHKPKVPTKLKHPFFLRPFTGLITNFGIPDYSGIDPTPIASIVFLAMFGIMFADVGHGGVLLLLGMLGALYPLPQLKVIRRFSIFIACCGASSLVFGFVFGNIFGKEEIIKPIWFSLENMNPDSVTRMLKLGVFFGVGLLSLGIILNIVQSFRRKNFKEAFSGQWGIFSLIFYWVVVFMFVTKRQFSWDRVLIIAIFLLPIMLKGPLSRIVGKKHEHSYNKHSEEEAESIIEAGFEIYEVVLSYLANTLSYIRMAAFNLSHAGLMMASYALTEELGGGGNILLSLPSDIMANAFVIALEGLIVAIQCMRLEYYEFFSKFFTGEGIEYRPLKIG